MMTTVTVVANLVWLILAHPPDRPRCTGVSRLKVATDSVIEISINIRSIVIIVINTAAVIFVLLSASFMLVCFTPFVSISALIVRSSLGLISSCVLLNFEYVSLLLNGVRFSSYNIIIYP